MMKAKNVYRVHTDGFHGELFVPVEDQYQGKALICFSGSDGKFELSRMLAKVFQSHGLTTLALAYVMEEGLPKQFFHIRVSGLFHEKGYFSGIGQQLELSRFLR